VGPVIRILFFKTNIKKRKFLTDQYSKDSAKSGVIAGLTSEDKNFIGVFPLKKVSKCAREKHY
jgi:hypothetical protein